MDLYHTLRRIFPGISLMSDIGTVEARDIPFIQVQQIQRLGYILFT